jgi:serine protease inhibitor
MNKNKIIQAILILFLALSAGGYQPVEAASAQTDLEALARGNNAFALELYGKLKAAEGNLFCSPYSISSALAMIYAGAEGATKNRMQQVLHFGLPAEDLHQAYRRAIERLLPKDKKKDYELVLANALWIMKGLSIRGEYRKQVTTNHKAQINEADFRRDTESARRSINAWVEKQSQGKFKEIIGQGVLTSDTRLVLTNVIYFHGLWTSQFKEEKTRPAPFTLLGGEKISAPMMQQTAHFNYFESQDLKALELPYKGSTLSLVILLPATHDGLSGLEASLTAENLDMWLNRMTKKEVRVQVPKFKMSSKMDLSDAMKSMGLTDLFSAPPADLSGIDGEKDLCISAVLHEAVVDVNEKGTEAAAATAGIARTTSIKLTEEFNADHPFVFLIRQTNPSNILFLGRLVNPLH